MGYECCITTSTELRCRKETKFRISVSPLVFLTVMGIVVMSCMMASISYVGQADNFTDIFYTNSFRGAFNWIKKLDWVGMIVQCVISCFSLFGVALMTVRIMTSMLYLSSKGLWEEVHDLKSGGGEGDKDIFGILGMAKSWVKGRAGTGLDAIVGAVLLLLPDVKKYSDFGEKSSGDFDQNMSISQYMLKIALPTIMTVFFFAMGFNGTLFQFLAITVDAMGTAADKAISINYAGIVEDLVNSGTGYKFYFSANETNLGDLQQGIAKNIYGRLVSEISGADAEQLYVLGKNVEDWVATNITYDALTDASQISANVLEGLSGDEPDHYVPFLGYEIVINGATGASGEYGGQGFEIHETYFEGVPRTIEALTENQQRYLHLFIKQTTSFSQSYFNTDGVSRND